MGEGQRNQALAQQPGFAGVADDHAEPRAVFPDKSVQGFQIPLTDRRRMLDFHRHKPEIAIQHQIHLGIIQNPSRKPAEHLDKTPEPHIVQAREKAFHVPIQIGTKILIGPAPVEFPLAPEPWFRKTASKPACRSMSK